MVKDNIHEFAQQLSDVNDDLEGSVEMEINYIEFTTLVNVLVEVSAGEGSQLNMQIGDMVAHNLMVDYIHGVVDTGDPTEPTVEMQVADLFLSVGCLYATTQMRSGHTAAFRGKVYDTLSGKLPIELKTTIEDAEKFARDDDD